MRPDLQHMGQVATALLVWGIAGATAVANTNMTGSPPCDALIEAGLGDRLLFAPDPEYETRIESWWSMNARLQPWCLFQPQTTKEISVALPVLLGVNGEEKKEDAAGHWHIAIRAGGHSGGDANNIESGVTIDLGKMNQTTYDRSKNIASIGPGGKWKDVYAELHKHHVLVPGGRDGGVGVGGFLLGGGSTFYMNTHAFACDMIQNYEVVLANGSVVNANKNENPDLWRALKGGSSNFGLVTRFDIEALPDKDLAYSLKFSDAKYTSQLLDGFTNFTDDSHKYPSDALVMMLRHNASTKAADMVGMIAVNTDGVSNSTGFERINQVPVIKAASMGPLNMSMAAAAESSQISPGAWTAGSTLTFKNDKRILDYATEIHKEFVRDLTHDIGKKNFVVDSFFQPLPSFFADLSKKQGGNMFASTLDKPYNSVLWTGSVYVTSNQKALALAQAKQYAATAKLQKYAESIDGDSGLVYLNYAATTQNPLGSYGKEAVAHMKRVAAHYDPTGAFQTNVPGGFKISQT